MTNTGGIMISDTELRDSDIRKLVLANLKSNYYDTVVIEELDLCLGECRVDLALVNGILKGIEIKSNRDTLNRLDKQIATYEKVFDAVEIVVGSKHIDKIFAKVPEWWGISIVTSSEKECLTYNCVRECGINNNKDPKSVLQLLWKNESLELLKKGEIGNKYKYKTRDIIWQKIIDTVEINDLYVSVNYFLKTRQNWRLVHSLKLNDD